MKKKYWMLGLFGGAMLSFASTGMSNGTVTSTIKNIEIGGQVRAYYDYLGPETYDLSTVRDRGESDDNGALRTRLNANLDFGEGLSGFVELHNATTNGATAVGTDDAGVTVHQGYMNVANIFGSPLDLKVGRYEMAYGDERLIGPQDFLTTSRHWDGATVRWHVNPDQTWIDFVYAELENGDVNNTGSARDNDGAGTAESANDDHDFYMTWLQHNMNDLELNLYWMLEDDNVSDRQATESAIAPTGGPATSATVTSVLGKGLERQTYGALLRYSMGKFSISTEYNRQSGHNGFDRVNAQSFAGVLGYALNDQTSIEYQYAWASGDGDPNDGQDGTFRPVYPSFSNHLGGADVLGWSNIDAHKLGVTHSINDKTSLGVSYWWFSRDNRDDAMYDGTTSVVRSGDGTSFASQPKYAPDFGVSGSNDIGDELDVTLLHDYSDNLTFELTWTHFFRGTFLRNTAGTTKDQDYVYFMGTLSF